MNFLPFPPDLAGSISKALLWCGGWLRGLRPPFGGPWLSSSVTASDVTDPVVVVYSLLIALSVILLFSPAPERAPERVETPTSGYSDAFGPGMQRVRFGRGPFVPDPTTDSGGRPRRHKSSAKLPVVDMARRSPAKSVERIS